MCVLAVQGRCGRSCPNTSGLPIGEPAILISLRVFSKRPTPTTVRINVDGNAPIDRTRCSIPADIGTDHTTTPELAQHGERDGTFPRLVAPAVTRARRARADPRGGGGTATLSVGPAPRVAPYGLTRTGKDAARCGA